MSHSVVCNNQIQPDYINGDFRKFEGSVTLTLNLEALESHIVRFVSLTSIHITIVHMALLSLIVNGRTDGRADRHLSTNVNRSSSLKAKMT